MTLTRLSGAKSLRDPLVSQLLGEWVASSPLAKAQWYEATEVAQHLLICSNKIEAVKQWVTYGLDCPQGQLPACVRVHDPPGGRLHCPDGPPISPPLRFTDTWKELVKLLALGRPVSVADPPTSGSSLPLQSWARYIQSRPPLVDTIDWKRPLTFLLRGHAYPCASWCLAHMG